MWFGDINKYDPTFLKDRPVRNVFCSRENL
jgi:hypothetical protein